VINNDKSIDGKLKVVFIEDYRVSNAEWLFAAADVSEQISTASKEASGTGNMKFMLNGAVTIGTMDGANVEMYQELNGENIFIFGMSSDEVIAHEQKNDYNPVEVMNSNPHIQKVLQQLVNGYYSIDNPELFRPIYNSLLNTECTAKADTYFVLKDFASYCETHEQIQAAYKDRMKWGKMALENVAHVGKFSSDRTIQEYVDDIWHLDKLELH
jgi:starch phosphorylase